MCLRESVEGSSKENALTHRELTDIPLTANRKLSNVCTLKNTSPKLGPRNTLLYIQNVWKNSKYIPFFSSCEVPYFRLR